MILDPLRDHLERKCCGDSESQRIETCSVPVQRRKWITIPREIEPVQAFAILPQYDATGKLMAFTVQDPEGSSLKRAKLASLIHKEYPGVSIGEVLNVRISILRLLRSGRAKEIK